MEKGRVLFICRGNTCRSQIASALVNARLSDKWFAISGGIKIGGKRDCRSKIVLQEIGINSHIPSARLFSSYDESQFDLIITLDEKAEQQAKDFFSEKILYHQEIEDPFKKGDNFIDCQPIQEEDLIAHRRARDELIAIVLPLVMQLRDS